MIAQNIVDWKTSFAMNKKYEPQSNQSKELILFEGEWIQIDPSQAWFWTDEWQSRHKLAISELENGDYEEFKTGNDFLNSIKNL